MENLMERIAIALEKIDSIQIDNDLNAQQREQLRAELPVLIETGLTKIAQAQPPIKNQINAEKFAAFLAPALINKMPNIDALTSAGRELVAAVSSQVKQVPTEVEVKIPDVYGMTSYKAFWAYLGTIIVILLTCTGVCLDFAKKADELAITKVADELVTERDFYRAQIENYKETYPKYADLFPSYDDSELKKASRALPPLVP